MTEIASVTIYDPSNGRIVQTLAGSFEFGIKPTLHALGLPAIDGEYDSSYWVSGGEAVKRAPCPASLVGRTLVGVEPGSTIVINSQSYPCAEGGDVELEFDQPGTYRLRIVCWPYLDGEFQIENPPL